MPKISIIVPIYNSEKYLKECLDSLVNQTFKDIEIICVNDGSTDNSLEIVKHFAEKDFRIKVINQENKGQSAARNAGLKIASGEWITFIDSDDYIDLNTYERVLTVSNVDVICFGIEVYGDNLYAARQADNEYYKIKYKNLVHLNNKIRLNTDVSVCDKLFRKEIIDNYNINFPEGMHFEDAEFYWKYILCCKTANYIDEYFYHYRRREDSIMHNAFHQKGIAIEHLYIIENLYKFMIANELYKNNINLLVELFKQFFSFAYMNTKPKNQFEVLGLANIYANKFFSDKKNKCCFIKALQNGKYDDIWEPDLKFYQKIFGVQKVYHPVSKGKSKYIFFFGFKIKLKNKNQEIISRIDELKCKLDKNEDYKTFISMQTKRNEQLNSAIVNLYIRTNVALNSSSNMDNLFNNPIVPYNRCYLDTKISYINYLFDNVNGSFDNSLQLNENPNFFYTCGTCPNSENAEIIASALKYGKKAYIIEDCFLRSIFSVAYKNIEPKYQKSIGFTIDDLTSYYDASYSTRLEQMLNDKNIVISDEQKMRAKKCIEKIISTHLSKYNNQPIFEPQIGRKGVKKVLVVDQSYGDMSISRGWGSEEAFRLMLEQARNENPDADIIVKTHPDTISGTRGGYYTGLAQHDNIYPMTEPINPISLIKYCDKVYVCTTQLGFEALMCGKEVHVFGMPFYAGWGLTHDRQKCERRTNTRTLEEVFYIAYIMYSYYVNPDKKCRCEIEEAMDYLLKLREEYFKELSE